MAQQEQIKTTINRESVASGSLEARLINAHKRMVSSKSAQVRELVLSGFLMRELGLGQLLLDLEYSGALEGLTLAEKKKLVAEHLFGDIPAHDKTHTGSTQVNETTKEQEQKYSPEAKNSLNIGQWGGLSS